MLATLLKKKPLGNHPFEKPRRRWERNVKLDRRKTGFAEWRWMEVAGDRVQCRVVVTVLNLTVFPPWCTVAGCGNGVEPYVSAAILFSAGLW
jgi:hypothetical protein